MGDLVIVAYRPKPGRDADLETLTREHWPYLRELGLVTERAPAAMHGAGGVVVEVFEWCDGAIKAAHGDPRIHQLWARYEEVCDYVPLAQLPEAAQLFATFEPIDL